LLVVQKPTVQHLDDRPTPQRSFIGVSPDWGFPIVRALRHGPTDCFHPLSDAFRHLLPQRFHISANSVYRQLRRMISAASLMAAGPACHITR
jgi:hypothetical protein